MPGPSTLFDKVWSAHEVTALPGGDSLLYVDRHLIHDLEAGPDPARLARSGRRVRRADLTFATPDHPDGVEWDYEGFAGVLVLPVRLR